MLKAIGKKIQMVKGDFGIPLSITITGQPIASDETIKFCIENDKGQEVLTKSYANIINNKFELLFTEEESKKLKPRIYLYKIDWYKEEVFKGNIVRDEIFEVLGNNEEYEEEEIVLNLQIKTAIPTKEQQSITYDKDYDALGEVIIEPIPSEYIIPKLENLTLTPTKEVQTFNHPGSDGYDNVTINPIPEEYIVPEGNLDVIENGEYDITEKKKVNVNVQPELEDLTIVPTKETQTFKSDKYGYNNVNVEAIPNDYIIPTGTLEVTENGEYDVTEKDKVNVSVEATGGATISDCSYLFAYNARLDVLDELLSMCKNITKTDHMFQQTANLRSLDLSGLDFSQVQNMEYMFHYCLNLPSIDLTGWNTQNVTNMKYTFANMNSLTQIDMRGLNTSKVTTMEYMLNSCYNLVSANLSGLDVSKVTTMERLFNSCSKLENVDLTGWDTSESKSFSNMFSSCPKLTSMDISHFNGSKATSTTYMFSSCSSLTKLIINNPNVFPMTNVNMLNSTPIKNGTGYVYVPDNLVETYRNSTNWSTYASQIKGMSELPTEEV